MYSSENQAGRLIELRIKTPVTDDEARQIFHRQMELVHRIGQFVAVTDLREAHVFPGHLADRFIGLMKDANPLLERSALLVSESAVFGLQAEREVEEAGNPQRRGEGDKMVAVMKVMIDLSVVPIGVGVSVSKYVAACQEVLEERGLEHQLHPFGTVVQGEWDAVFAAVKRCHEVVHEMGAPRVTTIIKVGTRIDREQTMAEKVRSVEQKLAARSEKSS